MRAGLAKSAESLCLSAMNVKPAAVMILKPDGSPQELIRADSEKIKQKGRIIVTIFNKIACNIFGHKWALKSDNRTCVCQRCQAVIQLRPDERRNVQKPKMKVCI
jgi:hypothetical protein